MKHLGEVKHLEGSSWKDFAKKDAMWQGLVADLERILAHDPENVLALTNLGALYSNLMQYEAALQVLLKAVQLNCKDSNLYFTLGVVSIGLEQEKEAKKYFKKALSLEPNPFTLEAYIHSQVLRKQDID